VPVARGAGFAARRCPARRSTSSLRADERSEQRRDRDIGETTAVFSQIVPAGQLGCDGLGRRADHVGEPAHLGRVDPVHAGNLTRDRLRAALAADAAQAEYPAKNNELN
jgi:hypothetical protein